MRRCLCLPLRRRIVTATVTTWTQNFSNTLHGSQRFYTVGTTHDGPVSTDVETPNKEDSLPQSHEYRKIEEQIRGLPEEDQRLILSALQNPEQQPSSKMGGAGIGTKSGDMVAAFTCGRCEHRMVKKFSKHAYTKGIVIVQCSSCEVKHLLADNLGWFVNEARNIEDMLREKGDSFVRIGNDYQVEPPNDNKGPSTKA
ncbi:zf-DNL-domain-containing protein [Trypanosoma grayi]|uniref:zf-DNL-domain-containing protein n=1 Tax=Trypanosoma grayi TaxID=71804 RepID=UPI0004F4B553|nr:zf-DNL-domain-containing protein [Trypanosoma grayi]KEG13194.1 zf-DNL-domain-containing protein [Trypanosoma grayi]